MLMVCVVIRVLLPYAIPSLAHSIPSFEYR